MPQPEQRPPGKGLSYSSIVPPGTSLLHVPDTPVQLTTILQNISAQIRISGKLTQTLLNIGGIDRHGLTGPVG